MPRSRGRAPVRAVALPFKPRRTPPPAWDPPRPMRLAAVTGADADDHVWFNGSGSVWMVIAVTTDITTPPHGHANDIAAIEDVQVGQGITVTGRFDDGAPPMAVIAFWISQDHNSHWQTSPGMVTEHTLDLTFTVPAEFDESDVAPYYLGIGLMPLPAEGPRQITVYELTLSDGTTTYRFGGH